MREPQSTAELVCELCRSFYALGWASGSGGGISIREPAGILVAPSGVPKERLHPGDLFLLSGEHLEAPVILEAPADPTLRLSACAPLFLTAYRQRGANACLHSHSIWVVLAARLFSPRGSPATFVAQGLEMQKGLRGKGCFDRVEIPIIANTAHECQLEAGMAAAMREHEDVDAVIVAGHGAYVWGASWAEAKTQAECLDFLCRAAVESHRLGLPVAGLAGDE